MNMFLCRVFALFSRILNRLSTLSTLISRRFSPKDIQERMVIGSTRYDMVQSPDEPYYFQQYWKMIEPHLSPLPENTKILDLGCSQGRFTVPIGAKFPQGSVVACDISADAISKAQSYASQTSVKNIQFHTQPVSEFLKNQQGKKFDVIVMTEIVFFYPGWKKDLPDILELLSPNALLIISFRPQYYNALYLVRQKLWKSAKLVLDVREGSFTDTFPIYTWQTSEEIKDLLIQKCNLELLELCGIGVCSGIPGDPHDNIALPSQLNDSERENLMSLELGLGKTLPDAGRYILSIAKNSKDQNA